jgi:hypothetical protein
LPSSFIFCYYFFSFLDADRFHSDVVGEERRFRLDLASKESKRLLLKRDQNLIREEKRWELMANQQKKEEDRMDKKRIEGLAAKKNAPSLPFNPITLEYSNNYDGGALQHHDDLIKYRSALRTHNLYTKQNSAYNPVTGALRLDVQPPPRPKTPPQVR